MTPTSVLAWSLPIFLWIIFAIFNIAIISLLRFSFSGVKAKSILKEKRLSAQKQTDEEVKDDQSTPITGDNTSYSRVSGMIGAIVLMYFFWAIGNILIFQGFENPDSIAKILTGVGPFILSGSALFAPYAFNQLALVFKTN